MPTAAVAKLKDAKRTTTTTTNNIIANAADARYSFDPDELQKLRTEAPWMKDAKYFQKVAISPSAIMKMMMHCHSGVEKGISKGGNPIEVMGMLLGRPDPETPHTLVVSDAFPLPIEGRLCCDICYDLIVVRLYDLIIILKLTRFIDVMA